MVHRGWQRQGWNARSEIRLDDKMNMAHYDMEVTLKSTGTCQR